MDVQGTCIVDKILRFEILANDLKAFCELAGTDMPALPHINRSTRRPGYRSYYTEPKMILRVEELFGDELLKANYEF